jgi:hypothetical protein
VRLSSGVNNEDSERVVSRMLAHVLPISRHNNTKLAVLMAIFLGPQTCATVLGAEMVGEVELWC